MKLAEAKRAFKCYLDQAATLAQSGKAGYPVPAADQEKCDAQVRAMLREIERCRTFGRLG